MLFCLWGQAVSSPKRWLRSTEKEKQLGLKGGQIPQVAL